MLLTIPWFELKPLTLELPVVGWHVDLQPFGLLVWVGTMLGIWLAVRLGQQQNLDDSLLRDLIFHCVVYGFIGAYLLNALLYEWDEVLRIAHEPKLIFHEWLGLSSVGGIVSGALGALIWKLRRRQLLTPYIDSVCAGLVLGFFFGRIGCFCVHDHPGIVSNFFLAVADFQTGTPPYQPRHDLGLYEALAVGALALIFYFAFRKRDLTRGLFTSFALIYYAPIRLALDFLRAPASEGGDARYFGFTPAQYTALGFLILGVVLYRRAGTITRANRITVTLSPPS